MAKLILEIAFGGFIALAILLLFINKNTKRCKRHLTRGAIAFSCVMAGLSLGSGVYLQHQATTTDDVVVQQLSAEEVNKLSKEGKVSKSDAEEVALGNAVLEEVCNNDYCWFTTVTRYRLVSKN